METQTLRQRQKAAGASPATAATKLDEGHPAGDIKHGGPMEIGRLLLICTYFYGSCIVYG